jgi:hypothetical protein
MCLPYGLSGLLAVAVLSVLAGAGVFVLWSPQTKENHKTHKERVFDYLPLHRIKHSIHKST